MTTPRFTIHDCMIHDAESDPVPKIYVRELLDYSSYEFQNSKLSEGQKLEVIKVIGLEILTNVLHECYQNSGATYDAAKEAQFTWLALRKALSVQNLIPHDTLKR